MLSRCVSWLLLRLLSFLARWARRPLHHYISFNRDVHWLTIGLTGFSIKFDQLRLLRTGWNKEILGAALPIKMHSVIVERFSLHFGVFSPVTVHAKGVYILMTTSHDKVYNAAAEEKSSADAKQKRLDKLNLDGEKASPMKSSWIRKKISNLGVSILFSIVRKAEVEISNVQVRMEDELSNPQQSLATGFSVHSVAVKSTQVYDEKSMKVESVSGYSNCTEGLELFSHYSDQTTVEKLQALPFQETLGYDYIVKPASISGSLQLKKGVNTILDIAIALQCSQLKFQASNQQLHSTLKLLSFFKQEAHFRCFLKYRPSLRPVSRDNAKLWWQFAFRSVAEYIKRKRGKSIWDQLLFRRSMCKDYTAQFEKFLTVGKPSKELRRKVKALEGEMELIEIIACRSKVWRELRLRRVIEDLSKHTLNRNRQMARSTDIEETSLLSISFGCELDSIQFLLTEVADHGGSDSSIFKLKAGKINANVQHQPIFARVSLSVNSIGVSGSSSSIDTPGTDIIYQVGVSKSPLAISHSYYNAQEAKPNLPLFSADFTVSHGRTAEEPRAAGEGEGNQKSLFDHNLMLSLQQTVLFVDKKTILKVASLTSLLNGGFNTDLKLYIREQAYDLQYQGKKRVKRAVTNHEIINVDIDARLPIVILPSFSDKSSSSDVALNLGHLELSTSFGDTAALPEKFTVEYDAKLAGAAVALSLQGEGWRKAVARDVRAVAESSAKLVSCPKIKLKLVEAITLQDGIHSIPKVHATGSVSSLDVAVSTSAVEAGVEALSQHMETLLQLSKILTRSESEVQPQPSPSRRDRFYRYLSREEPTDSRLLEVVDNVGESFTHISKQALQGGKFSHHSKKIYPYSSKRSSYGSGKRVTIVENKDGFDSMLALDSAGADPWMLELSLLIKKVSVEITCEEESLLTYVGGSVEEVRLKLKQSRARLQLQIEAGKAAVDDSCINERGVEIRPANSVLSTGANRKGHFISADMCLVDSDMVMMLKVKNQPVRNAVIADMGSLAFSISDSLLFSWVRVAMKFYKQFYSLDVNRFLRELGSSESGASHSRHEHRLHQTAESKGVINTSVEATLQEVTISVQSGTVAITKLCVSGLKAVVKDYSTCFECKGSVDSLVLLDCIQVEESYSKVVYSSTSEKVLKIKSNMKKSVAMQKPRTIAHSFSRPQLDPSALSTDLEADVLVGGVSCTLLFKFVSTLQSFFKNVLINLSKELQPLKSSFASTTGQSGRGPVAKLFKYHVSVNVHSVSAALPGGQECADAVKLQLESLLLSNKYSAFELSGPGGEAYHAIAETWQLDFHQLALSRVDREGTSELVNMPAFGITFMRIVTGVPVVALCTEPQYKLTFTADLLEMDASNHDIFFVASVFQRNLSEEPSMLLDEASSLPPGSSGHSSEAATSGKNKASLENISEENETEIESGVVRDILQLDANLKECKCTLHYVQTGKVFPIGKTHNTVMAELSVHEVLGLMELKTNGHFRGDAWMMDVIMKEVPSNHRYGSLERNDGENWPLIIHQDLYYKKTKPPRLGGGTMDTRRDSPNDTALKVSFDYFQNVVQVNMVVQHLHACVWPHLINPFLRAGERGSDSQAQRKGSQGKTMWESSQIPQKDSEDGVTKRVEKNTPPINWRVEFAMDIDNVSLSVLDQPSNTTSYGLCAEMISLQKDESSRVELVLSPSELLFSSDPLHVQACLMQFGSKIEKLLQVVEPCTASLRYSHKQLEEEETASISVTPVTINLSLEIISAILKPIAKILGDNTPKPKRLIVRKVSELENIWSLKELEREELMMMSRREGRGSVVVEEEVAVFTSDRQQEVVEGRGSVVEEEVTSDRKQEAEVHIPEVVVHFGVLGGGSLNSLLSVTAMLEAVATTWSSDVVIDAQIEVRGVIYNQRVAAWEPFIEPLEDPAHGTYRNWRLVAKVREIDPYAGASPALRNSVFDTEGMTPPLEDSPRHHRGSTASEILAETVTPFLRGSGSVSSGSGRRSAASVRSEMQEDDARTSVAVIISSDDRMEFTLSPGTMETILTLIESLGQDQDKIDMKLAGCSYFNKQPLQVRNETGVHIAVFPGPTFTLGSASFSKYVDLFPGDPKCPVPPSTGVVSGLAALTMTLPFLGTETLGDVDSKAAVDSKDKAVVNLHYANIQSSRKVLGEGGEGEGEKKRERDGEEAVLEEWDEFLTYAVKVIDEVPGKMNSLSKLKGYLKQRREESDESIPPFHRHLPAFQARPKTLNHTLRILAKGGKKSRTIPVFMPGLIPIPLYCTSFSGLGYGRKLVGLCEITDVDGARVVTIRSSVQIKNEFPIMVTLYQHTEQGTKQLAELQPQGTFNLPIENYVEKTPFKIGIGKSGYFGEDILDWSEMVKEKGKTVFISCPVDLSSRRRYYLKAVVSFQSVVQSQISLLDKHFPLISLKPALVLHNLLPMALKFTEKAHHTTQPPSRESSSPVPPASKTLTVLPGEKTSLYFLDPSKEHEISMEVENYRGLTWTGVWCVTAMSGGAASHHARVKLSGHNEKGDYLNKMKIGVYQDKSSPSLCHFYCPFWVSNKTGLKLEYEYSSKTLHKVKGILDSDEEDAVALLYFKPKVENKDRKVKIRLAGDGQWATVYLGTNGEAVDVSTKAKDGTLYEFGVQNEYSLHVLTQVIHILPKYVVQNMTELRMRLSGYNKGLTQQHVLLEPNQSKNFWPSSNRACILQLEGEAEMWSYTSKPFRITKIGFQSLVLNPDDKWPVGVTVQVSPDKSGSYFIITVSPYSEGTAPYNIHNFSKKLTIKFRQSEEESELLVPSGHSKLYSWTNPLATHKLLWRVHGEKKESWTTVEDKHVGSRKVLLDEKETQVFWRLTYDNLQKVLQVFDDHEDYKKAVENQRQPSLLPPRTLSKDRPKQRANLQVFCALEGVGVSLINSRPVEVMYCTIHSSPAVWLKRANNKGKFRTLDDSQMFELETLWRAGKKTIKIDSETFDLETLLGDRGGSLSRTFHPGLYCSLLVTDTHYNLSAKVGRVQVDNQLEDYVMDNRIIFTLENGVSPESVSAPMIDAAVTARRSNAKQRIVLVEDAYVALNQMQLNLELGVLAALIPLFKPLLARHEGSSGVFEYSTLQDAIMKSVNVIEDENERDAGQRFQHLAISPIKVTVEYSSIIAGPYDLKGVLGSVLESVVKISSTFTNGTIPIKLDSLQFTGETVTMTQLYRIVTSHYRNEVLSQVHSVVFGLDIIGNPSQLIHNFDLGIKDLIDESKKGFAHQKAGSGVAGVAQGVKELLGHVVEGSTGSLGSTTGTFRNTLLETTDLDYKKRHRLLEHEAAETLGGQLLLGTRFFAEGLLRGFTDIFTKPVTGASASGAKGFFQGVGRGALSILTKPTLGVVDLAYYTLEGIRSFADDDVETQPVRLPRLIHTNMIVTPYNIHEAQGLSILWRNPDNSKDTQYYGHHWLPKDGKDKEPRLLLINSLNVLKLKKSGKLYKVDDLNIKLEYLQEWAAYDESEGEGAALFLKYGDDSKVEKIGSFLGFSKLDHNAEVVNQSALVKVDSIDTAKMLVSRLTVAAQGVLVYYAREMAAKIS